MRPATDTFSWYRNSISDGFPRITQKIIEIPAQRLGFPKNRLVAGKDAAVPYSNLQIAAILQLESNQGVWFCLVRFSHGWVGLLCLSPTHAD